MAVERLPLCVAVFVYTVSIYVAFRTFLKMKTLDLKKPINLIALSQLVIRMGELRNVILYVVYILVQ